MFELESVWLEFYVYVDKFSRQLQHDVEIKYNKLNLLQWNRLSQTRVVSFLNSMKTLLTNKIIWVL